MKSLRLSAILILSAMMASSLRLEAQGTPAQAPAAPAVTPAAPAPAPLIEVDQTMYDFGKASSGEKVRHTFTVTNTGDAPLLISKVQPGCGCTTVGDWTHRIEPGQTGTISVQFDTSRYGGGRGGQSVNKNVDIYSNAKNAPRKVLMLHGTVWKPLTVTPTVAVFGLPADASNAMTTTVKIVNQTEEPIKISNPVSANKLFTAVLKEVKPGKEYDLLITAEPPFKTGNTMGTITVDTSLASSPKISVSTTANVPRAIQAFPATIILSSVQDRWITNRITIYGNTSKVLALANPKSSDSQIQVEVQPIGPKGRFNLVVAFPPGYHLAPGQSADVTVESNNPREPMLRIPIMQYPRPRAALMGHRNPPPPAVQTTLPPHP